jgi:2-iminobutanoate/2-iminopropanoate deaminase
MKNILEAANSDMSLVVKCTILLADMSYFAQVNAIYAEYFPVDPPARMTYSVVGLPLGALIEIDATAVVRQ